MDFFKKIDLGVMERGALAALLKNQVQFSTPTRQPAMICNSIPRESDVLFWPSLGIACTWCTEMQLGKTLINIKWNLKKNFKRALEFSLCIYWHSHAL